MVPFQARGKRPAPESCTPIHQLLRGRANIGGADSLRRRSVRGIGENCQPPRPRRQRGIEALVQAQLPAVNVRVTPIVIFYHFKIQRSERTIPIFIQGRPGSGRTDFMPDFIHEVANVLAEICERDRAPVGRIIFEVDVIVPRIPRLQGRVGRKPARAGR